MGNNFFKLFSWTKNPIGKIKSDFFPVIKYDTSLRRWKEIPRNVPKLESDQIKYLKFLSYNVWFEQHNFYERAEALNKIFEESNADFICLQEVINDFYNELIKKEYVKRNYFISQKPNLNRYDILILSKHPFALKYSPFPTNMGRSLIYAIVEISGKKLAVATSHFESLNSAPNRQEQLKITFQELRNYDASVLMGDFNFDNTVEEKNIHSDYHDLWKIWKKDDPGYTMPASHKFKAWRPDKFLLKENDFLAFKSINIIGKKPLTIYESREPYEGEVVTPSDHYGLDIILELKQ